MHAAIRYALWVNRHAQEDGNGGERAPRGFDEIPEVREILDGHLDPERDPSLAIRAIYGQWLPWLDSIDHKWALQNKERIYPAGEAQSALWNAAWDAYIRFVGPYDNILDLLRDVYVRAVEHIGEDPPDGARRPESAGERLVEHLMVFYGRGKLELDDPEGLLAKFYRHAPDRLRAQALWVVGRGLQQMDQVPPDVLERSKWLCERRTQVARSSDSPGDYKVEMTAVGWLFASLKFEDAWALTQLRNALEVSGKADPDRPVICPQCDLPVILHLGQKNAHHAAHKPEALCALTAPETVLHINTKAHLHAQLSKAKQLYVYQPCYGWWAPDVGPRRGGHVECFGRGSRRPYLWLEGWDRVEIEKTVGGRRPDIVFYRGVEAMAAIEVKATHAVDVEKRADLDRAGLPWLEVEADEDLYDGEEPWTPDQPLNFMDCSPELPYWTCEFCLKREEGYEENVLKSIAREQEERRQRAEEARKRREHREAHERWLKEEIVPRPRTPRTSS
jgi:hypothetical protein